MRKYNLALNLLADKLCDNCCFKSIDDICAQRDRCVQLVDSSCSSLEDMYVSNLPKEKTCMKWRSKKNPKPVLTKREIEELLKACLGEDYDKKS